MAKQRRNIPYADNTNLAYDYDFDHFDEERIRKTEKREDDAIAVRMQMAKTSKSKTGSVLAIIACIAAVFCALNLTTYYNTECYDLASKVAQQQTLLKTAQEENALLQSKLDSKVNINYIEEYATTELGMQKVTAAQKSFVSVNTSGLVEATEDDSGGFFGSVRRWFSNLMEYIGF